MKRMILVLCCLGAVVIAQDKQKARKQITIGEIQAAEVIGSLGKPLGTCFRIRATIVRGGNTKADDGRYFLSVTHVEDRELAMPVRADFSVHRFATKNVKLASNHFELYEMRIGQKAKMIEGDQIEGLERGYVGKVVDVVVYETGGFIGIPENLPQSVGVWQDYGYCFLSRLMVMDQQ